MLKSLIKSTLKFMGIEPTDLAYTIESVKKKVWSALDTEVDRQKLMVDIGGLRRYQRHWKTLDYCNPESTHYRAPGVDYNYNMLGGEPYPFTDNSVSFFYSSHTFEHLLDDKLLHNFKEIYRTLKPGGAFRMTTPDFDTIYTAFRNEDWFTVTNIDGDHEYNRLRGAKRLYGEEKARQMLRGWPEVPRERKPPYTPEQLVNAFVNDFAGHHVGKVSFEQVRGDILSMSKEEFANHYNSGVEFAWKCQNPGCHTVWLNYEKAERLLKEAGFKTVYKSAAFESRFPEMVGVGKYWAFDWRRVDTALYVEAVKSA